MIVGIGIDLAEIKRFQRIVKRRPELLDQVYSAAEQQVFRAQADPLKHFAASFAIKEAVFKALGQGWLESELFWKDIELLSPASEARPIVRLSGAALKRYKALGGEVTLASISHCERLVVAQVVILSDAQVNGFRM